MLLQFLVCVWLVIASGDVTATYAPPLFDSAQLNWITGHIQIKFSTPTDRGEFFGSRPCTDLILANVTNFRGFVCRFVTDTSLFVDPVQSNGVTNAIPWQEGTKFILKAGIIKRKSNGVAYTSNALLNTVVVRNTTIPQIIVSGPATITATGATKIPKCIPFTQWEILGAEFSAYRPWSSLVITIIQDEIKFVGPLPVIDPQRLTFGFNSSSFACGSTCVLEPGDYRFTISITNAYGAMATSPVFGFGVKNLDSYLPTMIKGGNMRKRVFKTSDVVLLSASTVTAKECTTLLGPSAFNISYTWSAYDLADESSPFSVLIPTLGTSIDGSDFSFDPRASGILPLAGRNKRSVGVRVEVRVLDISGLALLGEAQTVVEIQRSDLVLIVDVPSYTQNNTDLVVKYKASCDPDFPPCDSVRGDPTGTRFASHVLFTELRLETYNSTSELWELPENIGFQRDSTLSDGIWIVGKLSPGVYRIGATAERQPADGRSFHVYKIIYVVVEHDQGSIEPCMEVMNMTLPGFVSSSSDFPPRITASVEFPLVLVAELRTRDGLDQKPDFEWKSTSVSDSFGEDVDFDDFASAWTTVQDRTSLSILPDALFPGFHYTFRVKASISCALSENAAFGDVTFRVNQSPRGGSVVVDPRNGIALSTTFTLTSFGFVDPDGDLPIQYRYEYLRAGGVSPVILGPFSASRLMHTRLASGRIDCRRNDTVGRVGLQNTIWVTAKDSLGATASTNTTNFEVAPFFQRGVATLFTISQFPSVSDVSTLAKRAVGGSLDDISRIVGILANEAAATDCASRESPNTERQALYNWRQSVARDTIRFVVFARQILLRIPKRPNTEDVHLLSSILSSAVLDSFTGLDGVDVQRAVFVIGALLNDADVSVGGRGVGGGGGGPESKNAGGVSVAFAKVFIDLLAGLGRSVQGVVQGGDVFQPRVLRRALQGTSSVCDVNCDAVSKLRKAIQKLMNIVLRNFEPGSPPLVIKGLDIEIVASRELRDNVGSDTGVRVLALENGPSFSLPPNVLADSSRLRPRNFSGLPDTIDVVVVRFRFNVLELVRSRNAPPGVDMTRADRIRVSGVVLPSFTIREVNTILFLNSQNPDEGIDPYNLTNNINISIPVSADYVLPVLGENAAQACGFWDSSFSGWSGEGCTVVRYDAVNRIVVCSCNHASDFSAWNAFLTNLGGGEVGLVATIALVVVGILLPGLLIMWLLSLWWAHSRDENDAHAVHLGALVLLTTNKIKLQQRQRRFFQLLRENAKNPQLLKKENLHDTLVRLETAKRSDIALREAEREKNTVCCMRRSTLLGAWLRAVRFEHSLIGLFTRFDPYYSRTQRVTVIMAIIVGNLFAASFFFEFKTTLDLSAEVLVAVIVAAALVVALPIKILFRWLFRATEASLGSRLDRCAQIYRVSAAQGADLLPAYTNAAESADLQMLMAFKDYYASQSCVAAATKLLGLMEYFNRSQLGIKLTLRQRCLLGVTRCKFNHGLGGEPRMMQQANALAQRLQLLGEFSRMDVEKCLEVNRFKAHEALTSLRVATEMAREEWIKIPNKSSVRVETLRKQQSTVMRFTALLYDETEDRATPKPKWFKSSFLLVAWGFVVLYMLGGLAYSARWVLGRTSYRVSSAITQAEDVNGIIIAWLLSALVGIVFGLFLIEPLMQFIRFGLAAFALKRLGHGTSSEFAAAQISTYSSASNGEANDATFSLVALMEEKAIITMGVAVAAGARTSITTTSLDEPMNTAKIPKNLVSVEDIANGSSLMDDFNKRKKKKKNERSPAMELVAETITAVF